MCGDPIPAPARVHCGTPGTGAPGDAGSISERKEAVLRLGAKLTGSPRRIRRFAYLNQCSRQSNTNHNDLIKFLRNKPQRDAEREHGRRGSLRVRQEQKRAERERLNPYLGSAPFESPTKELFQTPVKAKPRKTFVDSRKRVIVKSDQLLRLQNSTHSIVTPVQ